MAVTLYEGSRWQLTFRRGELIERYKSKPRGIDSEETIFEYNGRKVRAEYTYGRNLLVETEGKDDEEFKGVIDAFSTVMGYCPVLRYDLVEVNSKNPTEKNVKPTYVWDLEDITGSISFLRKIPDTIKNLVHINS